MSDLLRIWRGLEAAARIMLGPGICALICFGGGVNWALVPFNVLFNSGSIAVGSRVFGTPDTSRASRRESRGGYTTYWVFHQPQIDLVDSRTGLVIRPKGTPPITKAQKTSIMKFKSGNIRMDSKVPSNNIPGSYAQYTKLMDDAGETLLYTKTTYGCNGEFFQLKVKYMRSDLSEYKILE